MNEIYFNEIYKTQFSGRSDMRATEELTFRSVTHRLLIQKLEWVLNAQSTLFKDADLKKKLCNHQNEGFQNLSVS